MDRQLLDLDSSRINFIDDTDNVILVLRCWSNLAHEATPSGVHRNHLLVAHQPAKIIDNIHGIEAWDVGVPS